jgi:hypothetical protein
MLLVVSPEITTSALVAAAAKCHRYRRYTHGQCCGISIRPTAVGLAISAGSPAVGAADRPDFPGYFEFLSGKIWIDPEAAGKRWYRLELPSKVVTGFVEIDTAGVSRISRCSDNQISLAIGIEVTGSKRGTEIITRRFTRDYHISGSSGGWILLPL